MRLSEHTPPDEAGRKNSPGRAGNAGAGRPSKLTSERVEITFARLRDGQSRAAAARQAGIHAATLYRWLERGELDEQAEREGEHRAFRDAVELAEPQALERAAETVWQAVDGYDEITSETHEVVVDGEIRELRKTKCVRKRDPQLALEILARLDPARWGRKSQLGEGDEAAMTVVVLSPEDAAAYEQQRRARATGRSGLDERRGELALETG